MEGTRAVFYGHSLGRRLSISLGMYATVFQAEVYAILACVFEIQAQVRPEKFVSICSDSQVALKALHIAKMTSPLVQLCQKTVSTQHTVELYWVPGHAGVRGNKITNKLARGGSEVCRT
jgi:ribonuclease HI